MDVQTAPPTYTPVGAGRPAMGNPPVLGSQVPGMSGGLPAQGGLSVLSNPMAQQLQSMGRGDDTMLVHMTPEEVNSLQGLAMAAGGSLTINPQTGLPEAGFLKKLLPMIAGIGLNFILPGSGLAIKGLSTAAQAGLMTGAATTALTGNLQKGLMAGLGAFGGASLAGGVEGALASGAKSAATTAPVSSAVTSTGPLGVANAPVSLGSVATPAGQLALPAANLGAQAAAQTAAQTAATQAPNALARFGKGFAETARGSMTGIAGKAAVPMAGLGVLSTISDATTPGFKTAGGQIDNSYEGPTFMQKREPVFAASTDELLSSSKERNYFPAMMPEIYNARGQLISPGTTTAPGTMIRQAVPNPRAKKNQPMYSFRDVPFMGSMQEEEEEPMGFMPNRGIDTMLGGGFAEGGEVNMRDGSFVVDARTVSELGNGSSNAGIEMLSRMGGRPVRGPGDGVSDSVRASIGGKQEARVARDEVIFPPEAVRRLGGGNEAKGTKKLYALMDKAHKARKKAKRGQDTRVRKGLA